MRRAWVSLNSEKHPRAATGLFADTATLLFLLTVGTASPMQADTFPVTGTAGFETGLHDLAFVTMDRTAGARVNWGDGTPEQVGLLRCFEPILHPRQCHVYGTHVYANPGTYTITIVYNEPRLIGKGPEIRETTTATISPVGDFVILSIGDSVASGEGDPVVAYGGSNGSEPNQGFWDDPGSDYSFAGEPLTAEEVEMRWPCHRSSISGPAQAARQLAATNPVTFVHFSCSGATVKTTMRNVSNAVNQLRIARSHLPRIDVLLISAGANNMHFTGPNGDPGSGFGDVLSRCLKPFSNCSNDPGFAQDIRDSLAELAGEYDALDQEIHCINPDNNMPEPNCTDPEKQIPRLVLITEYMDPTHVEEVDNPAEEGFPGFGCLDLGIRADEWKFLYNNVVVPLNQQVRASPWPAVVGMQDDFMAHGYCAGKQRWIVTTPDSEAALGGIAGGVIKSGQGTGHPNADGHADYRDRIHDAMVRLNPPVTTANATAGGRPYLFGTRTSQDVEVTLAARNPIRESGVGRTYFAVDNPACAPPEVIGCSIYDGPFVIGSSGTHSVSFSSENQFGAFEPVSTVVVRIETTFVRGDSNASGAVDISDALFTINYLFVGGSVLSCRDAADSNDDGQVDIADPVLLLNAFFAGGATLPAPFPECGADPTPEELGCESFEGCE